MINENTIKEHHRPFCNEMADTDYSNQKVLIIDDDKNIVRTISKFLGRMQIPSDFSLTLDDGLKKMEAGYFDVILLDVILPDGNGIENIKKFIGRERSPIVIMMTAYSDPEGAEQAIENGAWNYIIKPISIKELKSQTKSALAFQKQKIAATRYTRFKAPDILGESPVIQRALKHAAQVSLSDANVLISGETGTGKELFARAIHANSERKNGPFVTVDCGLLSENLIESVLFGHLKGAFTSAERNRKGLVALADGGTLFLDEVGELPESVQAAFLRVLQEKRFRPVGSEEEYYSNFRVICATNRNLEQLAKANRFRTDLLYRLKTLTLDLPPLRERKNDILNLATWQIKKRCREQDMPEKELSTDFVEALENYDWPGNVRELSNTIETSVVSSQLEKKLFAFHLPPKIRAKIICQQITKESPPGLPLKPHLQNAWDLLTHRQLMEKTESDYLSSLYNSVNGNISQLIERSGLSRTVLYRKLKKYRIK